MSVNKETGEVIKVKKFSKDCPHPSVGLDISAKPIQHKDFVYDPDSRDLKVVDTDIEDREAYIQSFAEECGVYNIMKMYSKTGDVSLLNRSQGFYGDISNLPEDDLNPGAREAAAIKAVGDLSKTLGVDLSVDELASMDEAALTELINKAVQAKVAQQAPKEDGGAE